MARDRAGEVPGPAAHVDHPRRGAIEGSKRIERRITEELGFLSGHKGTLGGNQLDAHEHLAPNHVGERRARGATLRHGAGGAFVISRDRRFRCAHDPVRLDGRIRNPSAPKDGSDFIEQRRHDGAVFSAPRMWA